MDKKKCSNCQEQKDFSDFEKIIRKFKDGTDNIRYKSWCKICLDKRKEESRKRSQQKFDAKQKEIRRSEKIKQDPWKSFDPIICNIREQFLTAVQWSFEVKLSRADALKEINYSLQDLINHLSSQLTIHKLENFGIKHWRIFHKQKYNYTSVNDKNFKLFWSLENLIVKEKGINYVKEKQKIKKNEKLKLIKQDPWRSDDLTLSKIRNSLLDYIQSGLTIRVSRKEISANLGYTLEELGDFLKLKLKKSKFEDYSKEWKIYHKIRYIYSSINDINFKLFWALDNLYIIEKSLRKKERPHNVFRKVTSNRFSNLLANKCENKITINKNIKGIEYTTDDLKNHIEDYFYFPSNEWMTWENYGKYDYVTWKDDDKSTWKWQLDHIIPHSLFEYSCFEDESFKLCWSLDNLRPLSAKQNFYDGVTKVRHKIY